ncbi:MAG: 16S rRNA (cytidine(1402)-2'-O)-methyltransferase [Verrucomicrobia bacterium]|nr:MAG: 16S rRNA (cytidine(1402)-2'-O)-methyltransferase [Verrucomicrobiota bacterium]
MLTIIPTPIGNLGDITLRAIRSLREADYIAAEDTRHASILLRHLEISKPLVSFHEHNEAARSAELIGRLKNGFRIALISDAGMPGISDPGSRLIRLCIAENLYFTVLPGPSAILTALVGSGFPTEKFYFGGFLPNKSGQRCLELQRAVSRSETSVYFESPHRLVKSLTALVEIAPQILTCVARELSKKFEEYHRGSAADTLNHFLHRAPKGEIVLLIRAPSRDNKSKMSPGESLD